MMQSPLDIIDRKSAWAWIRAQYFPGGVICPACGAEVTGQRALASFADLARTYCKSCGGTFQAKAAVPVLRGTEWQPEEYVRLLILQYAGANTAQVGELLGKSVSCVQAMQDRQQILTQSA